MACMLGERYRCADHHARTHVVGDVKLGEEILRMLENVRQEVQNCDVMNHMCAPTPTPGRHEPVPTQGERFNANYARGTLR
jgi:hypothetical protein